MATKPKYVVIGGGTGSFPVLSGLKSRNVDLTALVGMADDGGSTGTLRDELGVLPPGDVRQCLVALSSAPEQLRDLFSYRFEDGTLAGHSFGNLFLSAAQKTTGTFGEAVRMCSELLRIKGRVLPVTIDDVHLRMELSDHTILKGQRKIDDSHFCDESPHPKLFLEPRGRIAPEADEALRTADIIIIAPGDIYTSLGPLLIVDGVASAMAATHATVIYICNLVVKAGHTTGKTVADHAAEIERIAGGKHLIDYVLYNTASAPPALLEQYKQAGELMVAADAPQLARAEYRSVGRSLISSDIAEFQAGDLLAATGRRSFIRHNATAVADAVLEIAKRAK
ncbi:MAG TPA: gluconeogenesis factor YvcK family protein [Candidatus Saccharimonadales bacterium]|nr:gluconeogenesis factor YvcK family protein [Candidatus Saccharimonadales bacterium]